MILKRLLYSLCAATLSLSFIPACFADAKRHEVSPSSCVSSTKIVKMDQQKKKAPTDKKKLNKLIAYYAHLNKVPVKIAHAIIHTESNYNAMAHGKAGEIGLMQLMPTTARSLGFKGPLTDLYKAETNLRYGMRYLAKASRIAKGNTCRMVLKYNAGYHAKRMNSTSARYCKKVKHFLATIKKKSAYNIL